MQRRWLLKQNGITKISYPPDHKDEALKDTEIWGGKVVRMSLLRWYTWRIILSIRDLLDMDSVFDEFI